MGSKPTWSMLHEDQHTANNLMNSEFNLIVLIAKASMSEWSKEPDLRPGSVSCVGSNPTRCNSRTVQWLVYGPFKAEIGVQFPVRERSYSVEVITQDFES